MVKIFLILMFLVILFGAPKFGSPKRGIVLTIPNGSAQAQQHTYSTGELVEWYYRERDFGKALMYEEQALQDMKYGSMDIDTICRLNAMLGGCYVGLGECEKGKPYIDTALKEYEEASETGGSAYIVRHIEGIYNLKTGEYGTAIGCFEEALRQAEAMEAPDRGVDLEVDIAGIFCDMGRAYMELGDIDSALEMLGKSYDIAGSLRLESEVAYVYYEDVLEPVLKECFETVSDTSDGEMGYDEWFSAQFGEQA
ncbi:MAG: tetratricopeptide repeat protein [Clostridium sp.]|nr:tetratricopeptide repeat protein [Clostridium sp.]